MKYYQIVSVFPNTDISATVTLAAHSMSEGKKIEAEQLYTYPNKNAQVIDYYEIVHEMSGSNIANAERLDVYHINQQSDKMILLVSAQMKALLEQFVMQKGHNFYAAKLAFGGEKYDYYLFKMYLSSYTNYFYPLMYYVPQRSPIARLEYGDPLSHTFRSENDLIIGLESLRNSRGYLSMSPANYTLVDFADLLFNVERNELFCISERLKTAIEATGLKGLIFTEMPQPFSFLEGVPDGL
jgi:hypothetical protein